MDRLEVTPEMRRRALERVAREDIAPARPRALPFPAVKKYLSIAACLTLLVTGAAALPRLLDPVPPDLPPAVMTAPPVAEAASLGDLSALVGFEVEPELALPFDVTETAYCAYAGELAEVTYRGAEQEAVFRQSAGTEDNSGDDTLYDETFPLDLDGVAVTLKGGGGAYVLAVWTDGAFSYSLHLAQGVPAEAWLGLLAG